MTARQVTEAETTAGVRARQYATFYVEGLLFGIDVLDVQEVLRYQEMTRVPLAPPVVQGLINLRGQIVTAIDMRWRLGLAPRADGSLPMNTVVHGEDGAVSLLVDDIGDVFNGPAEDFEPPPENLAPAVRNLIDGVYKMKDQLLLVLNTRKAIDLAEV